MFCVAENQSESSLMLLEAAVSLVVRVTSLWERVIVRSQVTAGTGNY